MNNKNEKNKTTHRSRQQAGVYQWEKRVKRRRRGYGKMGKGVQMVTDENWNFGGEHNIMQMSNYNVVHPKLVCYKPMLPQSKKED